MNTGFEGVATIAPHVVREVSGRCKRAAESGDEQAKSVVRLTCNMVDGLHAIGTILTTSNSSVMVKDYLANHTSYFNFHAAIGFVEHAVRELSNHAAVIGETTLQLVEQVYIYVHLIGEVPPREAFIELVRQLHASIHE